MDKQNKKVIVAKKKRNGNKNVLGHQKYFSRRDMIHVYEGWIVEVGNARDQPGIYVPVTKRCLLGCL